MHESGRYRYAGASSLTGVAVRTLPAIGGARAVRVGAGVRVGAAGAYWDALVLASVESCRRESGGMLKKSRMIYVVDLGAPSQ